MSGRSVVARLTIDGVEGVITGFRKAGSAAVEYASVASKAGDKATAWVDKNRNKLDTVAGSLLKFGAVGGLALAGMAKAAIDWESAWAGVTKTVDGTPEQLDQIEAGLRGLAKALPASHEEIAAVAEAAGQLGIETDSVVGFTKTMIDLGETTNLTAEEASSSLAQFMNIMGTSAKNVDRLGSAIVALGNDGASTERDIVQMGQRIAAAGNQIGMSETDVLAFASALSSTGVEAEAGGTAISKTFRQIDADVREGGSSLELIADTAGMTSGEFVTAWETDAGGAVASFVEGLGGMQSRGEDVNGVLETLGMTGERQADSILRLAGATTDAGAAQDILREALELGGQAWEDNAALAEEAQKRYDTRASQTQIAINSIKDEAITLGESLLPVIDDILSGVMSAVDAFSGLSDPAKDLGVAILTIGTAGALAVGGVGKLVTGLASAKAAINTLGISVGTATKAMGVIGLAIAAAGTFLASWMGRQQDAKAKVEAYTQAIREQGEVIGEMTRQQAVQSLQDAGVLDWAERLGVDLTQVTDAALGSQAALDAVKASIEATTAATDESIAANQAEMDALSAKGVLTDAELVRYTDLSNANDSLRATQSDRVSATSELMGAIEGEAAVTAEATDKAMQFSAAMGEGATATDQAAAAAEADAQAKAEQQQAIAMTAEEMDNLLSSTQAYANALLALSGSQIGVETQIANLADRLAELDEAGDESAYTLDLTTEAGRRNQQALNDLASSSMSYIETMYKQGASTEEIAEATDRARDKWVEGAVAMGMSATEANTLAEAYFAIPDEVDTDIEADDSVAQARVKAAHAALDGLPDEVTPEIRALLDQGKISEAEARIRALERDRDLWIRVHTRVVSAPVMGATVAEADGGLLDFYAHGGLRERHVAQIAPAGSWRVWAEPETGGEAYIPLAESKRPRSLQIWRETGRRLGVEGFADGAVLTQTSSVTTTSNGPVTHVYNLSFPNMNDVATIVQVINDAPRLRAQKTGVHVNG